MSLPVHLVESLAGATVGSVVEVTGDEAHHAVAVRRLREGEQVVLTDGLGAAATGEVASTGKRVFTVRVGSLRSTDRPEPAITVVQALPKGDRGELAVEMLTEVGVDVIVPWAASRSVARWKGDRAAKSLEKWRTTAREAAKQARRAWFPTVAEQASTEDVVAAEDLHDEVVHREAGGDRGDRPREVVLELEGVLGAALGRRDRAGEHVVVDVVLGLVVADEDLTGHAVDERGEGEGGATGDVDDIGLEDRSHRAVGHRQGPPADLLLLGEAGDGQPGPAAGDGGRDVVELRRGDADGQVGRGPQPSLQR